MSAFLYVEGSCCGPESDKAVTMEDSGSRFGISSGQGETGGRVVTSADDVWTRPFRARDSIFLTKKANSSLYFE